MTSMGPFEMIVLLVLIGTVTSIVHHVLDVRHGKKAQNKAKSQFFVEMGIGKGDEKLGPRLNKIEERLKVLESIVTSDSYDLKQKFRNLDQNN